MFQRILTPFRNYQRERATGSISEYFGCHRKFSAEFLSAFGNKKISRQIMIQWQMKTYIF